MDRADVTGLIVAGGSSRRFGTDKALAVVDGRPLIAHVHAALAPLCHETLVATGPTPRSYPVPGRVVVDPVPDGGPLAGLVAGLSEMRTPWLLAVAADLPHVTVGVLLSLLERAGEGRVVVAVDAEGRRQPLCAVYPASVRDAAVAQLSGADVSMRAVLRRLQVREVPVSDAALRNVNRLADL